MTYVINALFLRYSLILCLFCESCLWIFFDKKIKQAFIISVSHFCLKRLESKDCIIISNIYVEFENKQLCDIEILFKKNYINALNFRS